MGSLERSSPTDSIVAKLYALIAQCHNQLNRSAEAVAVCKEGQTHYPRDVELLFQEGIAHRHLKDVTAAIRCWEEILRIPEGPYFASVNTGICGYLTRHNLALAYADLGQFRQAEDHWQAVLAEQPCYPAAWYGLAEVAVKEQREDLLRAALAHLQTEPNGEVDSAVFQARMHLGREDFATARAILHRTIAAHPESLWPKVILSHVLLKKVATGRRRSGRCATFWRSTRTTRKRGKISACYCPIVCTRILQVGLRPRRRSPICEAKRAPTAQRLLGRHSRDRSGLGGIQRDPRVLVAKDLDAVSARFVGELLQDGLRYVDEFAVSRCLGQELIDTPGSQV